MKSDDADGEEGKLESVHTERLAIALAISKMGRIPISSDYCLVVSANGTLILLVIYLTLINF